jgi:hydroxypyruvate isomerase
MARDKVSAMSADLRYRFSANTGFLWKTLPFLDRLERAKAAGFDAVEFHDEVQDLDVDVVCATLKRLSLEVISINTQNGGTFGCAADPKRPGQARDDIDRAIAVAAATDAGAIHVLAGAGEGASSTASFIDTLTYALDHTDRMIVIEPISPQAVPGYFLTHIAQAADIISHIGHDRLKILFDCFHIQAVEGGVIAPFEEFAPLIGHVQIASFPARNEPFVSEIDYGVALPAFRAVGYDRAFGCEYHPEATVEAGLHWRDLLAS